MKLPILRHLGFLGIIFLSVGGTACAEPVSEAMQLQKAINLTEVACTIYPAIKSVDVCVDKVARKILIDRDVKKGRVDEIIRDQEASASALHKRTFRNFFQTREELDMERNIRKLVDIIGTACAIPPAITDQSACMDQVYHSILSSRDPNSTYFNQEEWAQFNQQMSGELLGIGAEIVFTEEKSVGIMRVMEDSPALRAGVQDGDRIVAITNDGVRELATSFANVDEALKKIRGQPASKVTLDILRGETDLPVTITVVRAAIKVRMVKTELLTSPTNPGAAYAYVRLTQFGRDLRTQMVEAVKKILKEKPDVTGIVFDVRANPGGDLNQVYEAVDALADSGEALVSIRTNEGIHAFGTASRDRTPVPQPGDITSGLQCAILIDRRSASASEIFAGGLSELGRCVTIGEGTWQKGSVQSVSKIGDGTAVKYTTSEYLIGSPTNWVAVQCVGVQPDIQYVAEGTIKPKKETHECDHPGAILSGGRRSHPDAVKRPLGERNPALYAYGLEVVQAVAVLDRRELFRFEKLKKLLKIKDKPEDLEEDKK